MTAKSSYPSLSRSVWLVAILVSLVILLCPVLQPGLAQGQPPGPPAGTLPGPGPAQKPVPPIPDPAWVEWATATGTAGALQADSLRANSLQADGLTVSLNLTDGSVAGWAPDPAPITARVERDGKEVSSTQTEPAVSPSGFIYQAALPMGCYYGYCLPENLPQEGDIIWIVQGTEAISLTVPLMTARADPALNRVSGLAPAGAELLLYLIPSNEVSGTQKTTVNASSLGAYEATWDGDDGLRPRDWGYVTWAPDERRQVSLRFVAPFLLGQMNSAQIAGFAAPSSLVELQVFNAGGELLSEIAGITAVDGSFDWYSYDYPSPPVLAPGDTILASAGGQSFSLKMVAVDVWSDQEAGRLAGMAPAGTKVEVALFPGPLKDDVDFPWYEKPRRREVVQAGPDGGWSLALPLAAADYGYAAAVSPDGHQILSRFAVPYVKIYQGTELDVILRGQLDAPSSTFTAAIQGPSGYLKSTLERETAGNGWFWLHRYEDNIYKSQLSLGAGDVITLSIPDGGAIRLDVPELTAKADAVTDQVRGRAPAGAQVLVSLYDQYTQTGVQQMVATADGAGDWLADWSSLGGFSQGTTGQALLKLPGGHETVIYISVGEKCPPALTSAQVGGNMIQVTANPSCANKALRLLDPSGGIKAQVLLEGLYNDISLHDDGGQPVAIHPGDRIVLEGGGRQVEWEVPNLSVSPQVGTNILSGQARPGELLLLAWLRDQDLISLSTVRADQQGGFTLAVAGNLQFEPGDSVWVLEAGPDTSEFYAIGGVPGVSLYPAESTAEAWLPPLSLVTVTVRTGSETVRYSGRVPYDGYLTVRPAPHSPGETIRLETDGWTFDLTLPDLSVQVEQAAGVVHGKAPAGTRVQAELREMLPVDDFGWWFFEGPVLAVGETVATQAGEYRLSFPDLAPLPPVQGQLVFSTSSDGRIILPFSTPHIEVTLGARCVRATAVSRGQPVTVTLQAAGGTRQDVQGWESYAGQFSACFERPIWPGDQLILQDPGGTSLHFTVPAVTVRADSGRKVVEGRASPNSRITVTLDTDEESGRKVIRTGQAGPDGRFGIDVSDVYTPLGRGGSVTVVDEAGNMTSLRFDFYTLRLYFPLVSAPPHP